MICIFTGEDYAQCNCAVCGQRRGVTVFEHGRRSSSVPTRPFLHRRRRPCPTGMADSLDGTVPYQPSRCANGCTCCAVCRGEEDPATAQWWKSCTCPSPSWPESNCERGHSALVECRGGCKPRPVPTATVVQRELWGESVLGKVWGAIRSLARWHR